MRVCKRTRLRMKRKLVCLAVKYSASAQKRRPRRPSAANSPPASKKLMLCARHRIGGIWRFVSMYCKVNHRCAASGRPKRERQAEEDRRAPVKRKRAKRAKRRSVRNMKHRRCRTRSRPPVHALPTHGLHGQHGQQHNGTPSPGPDPMHSQNVQQTQAGMQNQTQAETQSQTQNQTQVQTLNQHIREYDPASQTSCEQLSGRIFQTVGTGPQMYFTSLTENECATVRIDNDTPAVMTAHMETQQGGTAGTVGQGQQVTFVVPSLRSLSIECAGDNGICKGFYHIRLDRKSS